ncbi:MAG: hypothetical protein GOV02_00225 [Candidatus Aenigmarchaeota archaeon]|nr:hypothetical protein [Candidatus Aenigmarchaeota archaeon]
MGRHLDEIAELKFSTLNNSSLLSLVFYNLIMAYDYSNYPDNWTKMREAMFKAYGGKHCTEGVFKRVGHKGYIQLHHYVPLAKANNKSEYYFLNQSWNLIPCCERHHNKMHNYSRGTRGKYKIEKKPKTNKVNYLTRFGWAVKRQHYNKKFSKNKKPLTFWKYWKIGEKGLKRKMNSWPSKYVSD